VLGFTPTLGQSGVATVLLLKLIQVITIWVPWSFLEFLLDVGSPGVFLNCHLDVPDKV
jgi:hypothetical protein